MADPQYARREPAGHGLAQFALERTADGGDIRAARQLSRYSTQANDVLEQLLLAIDDAHHDQDTLELSEPLENGNCWHARERQLSPAHLGSNRIRGLKGAFARRSTIEIELHRISNLDPVAVAGQ